MPYMSFPAMSYREIGSVQAASEREAQGEKDASVHLVSENGMAMSGLGCKCREPRAG